MNNEIEKKIEEVEEEIFGLTEEEIEIIEQMVKEG